MVIPVSDKMVLTVIGEVCDLIVNIEEAHSMFSDMEIPLRAAAACWNLHNTFFTMLNIIYHNDAMYY